MATPYTVLLPGGGSVTVNANSPEAARENAGVPGGTVLAGGNRTISTPGGTVVNEANAPGAGGGGGGGGGSGGGVTAEQLDAQFQKMLAALASGNREAFNFEKDKFNQQFAESKREFDVGRSDQLAQFEKNFGLQQGQLTGVYNGQPTEAARQFNQSQAQNLGTTLLNAATQLRGPQDYLQYQQLTRGGGNLYQQLFGNQPVTQGGQPTGQLQPASLEGVLGDIFGRQQQSQQANPQAQLLQRFGISAGQQLNPTQIDPARWDAMGSIGQELTKNLASTAFGYDPADFEKIINATRPAGTARTAALSYAQPRGIF